MSDEEKNAGDAAAGTAAATVPSEQPFLDEHTTEPNGPAAPPQNAPPAAGKWEMPKPKFQQTSGYLPQGYLKDIEPAAEVAETPPGPENPAQEPAANVPQTPPSSATPAVVPVPDIEPQPDLADQLIPAESQNEAAKPPSAKKSGSRAVMIVLGLIGILIFIALFLAAVYFLFLDKAVESQF